MKITNPYGCDELGHDTFFEETQAGHCPVCGLDITAETAEQAEEREASKREAESPHASR